MITVWIVLIVVALAFALVAIIGVRPPGGRSQSAFDRRHVLERKRPRRILFPFVSSALSSSALEAALRLAKSEDATLVPVFLARVPMNLPLQAPLPRQSESALMLLETIEQRAAAHGVSVDARVQRGRDNRHALREAIASCTYDRIVIAAAIQRLSRLPCRRRRLAAGERARRDRRAAQRRRAGRSGAAPRRSGRR